MDRSVTGDELVAALEPVREHFRSKEITPNTVLAAHLRAVGLQPIGAPWQRAKAALQAGAGFPEAARIAIEAGRPIASERATGTEEVTGAEESRISGSITSQDDPVGAEEPAESPETIRAALVADLSPRWSARPAEVREDLPGPSVPSLDWFPKVFGPGDIDGDGAKRLLGTPNIPLVSVLVRETAQNSWDARLGTLPVRFTLHLRALEEQELDVIRDHVVTGRATDLGVREVLSRDEVWVLEVSDRGTRGLGGPVRNDLEVAPGVSTDFIDLIMNIGAPRDVHLGGGTYGFGKTVAYQISSCGTVVFWSRTFEEQAAEDRLIVSAIGPSFSSDGRRHTGRHWWGRLAEGGERIEPLRGLDAANMARRFFADDFQESETGTSIMILDPVLGGETRAQDAQRIADSVLWHLWPKLTDAGDGEPLGHDREQRRTLMSIQVLLNGEEVSLPRLEEHRQLSGFADALNVVRRAQRGDQYTPKFNTEIFEVHCFKPPKLLGHLALSRFPRTGPESDNEDEIPLFSTSSHVAWMRHDAELVVRYDAKQRLDADGLQWAGVFKPVVDVDDSFAASEPPAHDDWVPDSMPDKTMRRDVRVALTRIKELVRDFLAPAGPISPVAPNRSVAALADSLAGLVGTTVGSGPSKPVSGGGGTGSSRAQVKIADVVRRPGDAGRTSMWVRCAMSAPSTEPWQLKVSVGVGIEGGSDDSPEQVSVVGWTPSGPDSLHGRPLDSAPPVLTNGEACWLLIDAAADVAVDLSVTAVAVS